MRDVVPYPLFHGSSTLFLSSILKDGLGARNPLSELGAFTFAKDLFEIAKRELTSDEWLLELQTFKFMVEQRSAHMNFQHGQVYLTPSSETAVRYAARNRYGSEFLSCSLHLFAALLHREVSAAAALSKSYPEIIRIFNTPYAPLLVEVREVEISCLRSENGDLPDEMLEQHQGSDLFEGIGQQMNFRLTCAVPHSQIKTRLLHIERNVFPNPVYSLYELLPAGELSH